jgi:hypothetical protein
LFKVETKGVVLCKIFPTTSLLQKKLRAGRSGLSRPQSLLRWQQVLEKRLINSPQQDYASLLNTGLAAHAEG